ncbi:MAG: penicillin acylase family protein [Smithella sp.]|jgi:acyl-homoserine-lactone acylase
MRNSILHFRFRWHRDEKNILKVCGIIALCLLLGSCTTLIDRHFKGKLDASNGNINIEGLKETVTVRRDAYGIPFVEAKNMEDMAIAVGYVHASDRLTQMIGLKLISEGRLTEMAGSAVLNLDIYMRTMNLKSAAETLYKNVNAENLRLLKFYSKGVNAYLDQHKDNLPPGLALAGYNPEPWEPIDSLKIFALLNFGLSFNLHEEIAALNIAQAVGAEKTAWLLPIYPDEPIPLDEAAKLKGVDLNKAAASVAGIAGLQPLLSSVGLNGTAASNNWAISKERTKNGASIFCSDMHLPLSMPSMWNMMHVRCGSYDVAGMSLAGAPVVVAGYNGHIAWGMTMVMADNQDLFLEQLKTVDGKLHYLYKGEWLPATERKEVFNIKGKSPITMTFYDTVHGPLMNEALKKEPIHLIQAKSVDLPYGVALSRTVPTSDDDSMNAFFQLSFANSVDEAIPIIKRIRSIPLNMVFADKDNIAWQIIGDYPLRAKGRGLMPSPGWTGEYDWIGLLDPALLPNLKNPSAGFIGTANHRTVPKDYPYILSSSWYWPERAERIIQMASATDKHTTQTNMDMQLDTYSLFVPKLKEVILKGMLAADIMKEIGSWKDEKRIARARIALAMLQGFNGDMKADSKEAALMGAFLHCATKNIFLDELGPVDSKAWKSFLVVNNESYNATCDHLLVRGDESPFWDDINTPEKETKAQIIARSLADAVAFLELTLGNDTGKWSWGALHTYTWETDTSQMAPHFGFIERTALNSLWSYFNRGPYPAAGDIFTLNVSMYMMGKDFNTWIIPSMRMIIDFSKAEPMQAVNSSGQSDNPSSPHYDDGIKAWRDGKYYIPFPFKDAAVNAQYKDVLQLNPSAIRQ